VADWSQLFSVGAIGAVAGGVLTWFGGVLRSGFDHLLDQRKRRREEAQTIRAEQREEARKRAERQQIESEAAKKDEAVLLMYKIQLKGATDLPTEGQRKCGHAESQFGTGEREWLGEHASNEDDQSEPQEEAGRFHDLSEYPVILR
jgi:hypothetical protein